jgi:hypothetical protein
MLAISLSFVNWAFLLWNTSWMPAPCTCRLRRTTLQESTATTYVMQSLLKQHFDPKCFNFGNKSLQKHKLLAIGGLLAELTLGMPIYLERGDGGGLFFVLEKKKLSKKELLQKVGSAPPNIGML